MLNVGFSLFSNDYKSQHKSTVSIFQQAVRQKYERRLSSSERLNNSHSTRKSQQVASKCNWMEVNTPPETPVFLFFISGKCCHSVHTFRLIYWQLCLKHSDFAWKTSRPIGIQLIVPEGVNFSRFVFGKTYATQCVEESVWIFHFLGLLKC